MVVNVTELIGMKNVYVNKGIMIFFLQLRLVLNAIILVLNAINRILNVLNVYLTVEEFIILHMKDVIAKVIIMMMVILFVLNVMSAVWLAKIQALNVYLVIKMT